MSDTLRQQTLFSEARHANPTLKPGSSEAIMMTVRSGRKCAALLRQRGPLGSFSRMLLEWSGWCSRARLLEWKPKEIVRQRTEKRQYIEGTESSRGFWKILRKSDTMSRHLLYRLAPLMPRTGETGCGLWRTPDTGAGGRSKMISEGKTIRKSGHPIQIRLLDQVINQKLWPTPRAGMNGRVCPARLNDPNRNLETAVAQSLFPTPTARDFRSGKASKKTIERNSVNSGHLNPDWIEWMMGLPQGWTDPNIPNSEISGREPSEMPSCRRSLKPSGERSLQSIQATEKKYRCEALVIVASQFFLRLI